MSKKIDKKELNNVSGGYVASIGDKPKKPIIPDQDVRAIRPFEIVGGDDEDKGRKDKLKNPVEQMT